MSYRVYQTEGLVLRTMPSGEADRLFWVFTPDLGLCRVLAKGLRQEKSKLRANIGLLEHCELGLVRGREYWRLVHSRKSDRLRELVKTNSKRRLTGDVFRLLNFFVVGESASEEIYADLFSALVLLSHLGSTDLKRQKNLELLLVLRLLKHLGLLPSEERLNPLIDSPEWTENLLDRVEAVRPFALDFINNFFADLNW